MIGIDNYDNDRLRGLQEIVSQDYTETVNAKNKVDEQIKDLSAKISVLETLIQNNNNVIESLSSVHNVCPVCQSQIDDEHKENMIANYSAIIEEDKSKLEKRNKEFAVLQGENNQLTEMLNEKQKFVSDIEKAIISTDMIDKIYNNLESRKQTISDLDDEANQLVQDLAIQDGWMENEYSIHETYNSLLEKSKDYQQAQLVVQSQQEMKTKYEKLLNQYSEKENSLEEINQKILNIGFDSNLLKQYQAEQSQLHNQYYPLVKTVGQLENNIKHKESQIQTIDEKIKQNKQNKEQVKKLDDFIQFLKH